MVALTCISVTLYVHCMSCLFWGRINTKSRRLLLRDALPHRWMSFVAENNNLAYCSRSVLAVWLLYRRKAITASRLPLMGMWSRVIWYKCIGILEGLAAFIIKERDRASSFLLHDGRLLPYYGFTSQKTTVFCLHHQGKWWSGKISEPLVHTLHCKRNCIPLWLIVLVAVQIIAAL
jgi:hypothetical protein